jgi:hypothetical protein
MDGGIHAVIRSPDIYADLVGKCWPMSSAGTVASAATDARPQTGPQRRGDHRRARVGAEPQGGHYELAVEVPANRRLAVAFNELAVAI